MVFVLILLIAAAVVAVRYGADTRDGRDWAPSGDVVSRAPQPRCC